MSYDSARITRREPIAAPPSSRTRRPFGPFHEARKGEASIDWRGCAARLRQSSVRVDRHAWEVPENRRGERQAKRGIRPPLCRRNESSRRTAGQMSGRRTNAMRQGRDDQRPRRLRRDSKLEARRRIRLSLREVSAERAVDRTFDRRTVGGDELTLQNRSTVRPPDVLDLGRRRTGRGRRSTERSAGSRRGARSRAGRSARCVAGGAGRNSFRSPLRGVASTGVCGVRGERNRRGGLSGWPRGGVMTVLASVMPRSQGVQPAP